MRFLVACDDGGSIKEVICNRQTNTSVQTALQPFHVGTHLAESLDHRVEIMKSISEDRLLVARANGSVQLIKRSQLPRDSDGKNPDMEPVFTVSDLEVISSIQGLLDDEPLLNTHKQSKRRSKARDGFISLHVVPGKPDRVLCASRSGLIHVLALENDSIHRMLTHTVKAPLEFVQIYDNNAVEGKAKPQTSITIGFGGEENLVKLAKLSSDFENLDVFWQAKNVSNDRLDLKVPIWPMELIFLNSLPSAEEEGENYQFLTISHLGHFRRYQTARGRKPMSSLPLLPKNEIASQIKIINRSLTSSGNVIAANFEELKFLVTDSKKNIILFDTSGNVIGKYGNGDITGFASFVDVIEQRFVLQGGFDRYARIFDAESRNVLCKCYVGAKVSSIVLLDDKEIDIPQLETKTKKRKTRNTDDAADAEEDEELWNSLEKSSKKNKVD
ncbi:LADA_0A03048g1_1 [Lachancea dasiensis]|uniref:Ribosome biogenesis protein NSA1 n=1 Tax=Lachancea dasiensis TaxID=1072105 RepID=A0A1G4IMY9_9SACH|nr:LADA_0A03048g1_1 [Lachancea dasiensis]